MHQKYLQRQIIYVAVQQLHWDPQYDQSFRTRKCDVRGIVNNGGGRHLVGYITMLSLICMGRTSLLTHSNSVTYCF